MGKGKFMKFTFLLSLVSLFFYLSVGYAQKDQVEELIKKLKHKDSDVRGRASWALGG